MNIALSSCENGEIHVCLCLKLSDLEYEDDIVLLSEDLDTLHVFLLDHLNDSSRMFELRFGSWKCKTLLQDWVGSKLNLVYAMEELLSEVNRFS